MYILNNNLLNGSTMKKNLEISIRFAEKAYEIMSDITRQIKYEGIVIEQTSSTSYEWNFEDDEEKDLLIEGTIIEEFANAGIPNSEYEISDEV